MNIDVLTGVQFLMRTPGVANIFGQGRSHKEMWGCRIPQKIGLSANLQ